MLTKAKRPALSVTASALTVHLYLQRQTGIGLTAVVGAEHLTAQRQALLDGLAHLHGVAAAHLLEGVGRPALHHEQQVEGPAVGRVVDGKVLFGAVDVAAHLRREEHGRLRVGSIGDDQFAAVVTHRQRERALQRLPLSIVDIHLQHHGLVGLIGARILANADLSLRGLGVVPHHAACQRLPLGVEEHKLQDAARQRRPRQRQMDAVGPHLVVQHEAATVEQAATAEARHAHHVALRRRWRGADVQTDGIRLGTCRQGIATQRLGRRQGDALLAHHGIGAIDAGGQDEGAHALMPGRRRGHSAARHSARGGIDGEAVGHGRPLVVHQTEGDALRRPRHAPAALGIEGQREGPRTVVVEGADMADVVALAAVHLGRVERQLAALLGAVEDGDDAREAGLGTPVGHLAGIGPDLVIAGVDGLLQHKVAVGLPEGVEAEQFLIHHASAGVEKFDVEHTTDGLGAQR